MGIKRDISEKRRAEVKALADDGKSESDISRQIGCSQSTVSRIFKEFGTRNGVASFRKNSGWQRITMSINDRKLADITKKNRLQSTRNLACRWKVDGVKASGCITYRHLRELFLSCLPRSLS